MLDIDKVIEYYTLVSVVLIVRAFQGCTRHAFVALITIILDIGKMAHCTVMHTSLIIHPKGLIS